MSDLFSLSQNEILPLYLLFFIFPFRSLPTPKSLLGLIYHEEPFFSRPKILKVCRHHFRYFFVLSDTNASAYSISVLLFLTAALSRLRQKQNLFLQNLMVSYVGFQKSSIASVIFFLQILKRCLFRFYCVLQVIILSLLELK